MKAEKKQKSSKATLVKQTIAVVCITAVLGVIIAVIDSGVLQLLNLIIK